MQEHITLSGVPETMLQTVYARAKETRTRKAVIDLKAVEITDSIDYDFSSADKDKAMHDGVIARTIILDHLTKSFLEKYPGSTVVNIACGLDTRCYRINGYSHWYNLDLPETIDIRSKILQEDGIISEIGMSAMDDWSKCITEKDGKALVIIEGLTMYLSEEVKRVFSIIHKTFQDVEVLVEVMNPFVVKHFREKSIEASHARFTWGIRNRKELSDILPGFKVVSEYSLTRGMAEFIPIYKILDKIAVVRSISNRIAVVIKE